MPHRFPSPLRPVESIRPSRSRTSASWWKSPQRLWWRRAIFQIHLWIGLLLSLYAVVIGLSGSALVFRPEMEHALYGETLRLPAQLGAANFENAIGTIQAQRPGYRAVGLEDFGEPGRAATLLMRPEHGASSTDYRLISFDPSTGRVLLDRTRYAGILGWITNLHFNLLAGQRGLLVSGYMSLGLLLLCVTGVILWWPGIRRWVAALSLHRRARWQRLNWDLHSVIGFWCSAALSIVTFTGIYFAFPKPVATMLVWITGGESRHILTSKLPDQAKGRRPLNVARTLTVDEALVAIAAALPPDAPAGYIQLPTAPDVPFRATGYYRNTAPYSQLVQVTVDPHTGAMLASDGTRNASLGMRIVQYFFAIHFGSFAGSGPFGILVKCVWVLLGLTPALLAVTGMLMYWNRKLAPWLKLHRRRSMRDHSMADSRQR